jgi:hypothetical protein
MAPIAEGPLDLEVNPEAEQPASRAVARLVGARSNGTMTAAIRLPDASAIDQRPRAAPSRVGGTLLPPTAARPCLPFRGAASPPPTPRPFPASPENVASLDEVTPSGAADPLECLPKPAGHASLVSRVLILTRVVGR